MCKLTLVAQPCSTATKHMAAATAPVQLAPAAAEFVLANQQAIARAASGRLGYPVRSREVTGPAVIAAADRLARGMELETGWIAAAVCRELDPPRRMLDESISANIFAGASAERQYQSRKRECKVDGSNHRDPAHHQQEKRERAREAGQLELSAPGFWAESREVTEWDRELERIEREFDPASNRPIGFPPDCAITGVV